MAVLSTRGKNARRPIGERTLRQRLLRTRPRRLACTLGGRTPQTALRRPRETCSRTFRERTSGRPPGQAVPQSPGRFPGHARRPSPGHIPQRSRVPPPLLVRSWCSFLFFLLVLEPDGGHSAARAKREEGFSFNACA